MQPSELLELIKSRRSVRRYSGQPVEAAQVEMILEAGRWAPSGMNNQAWRFVVVADPAVKESLAQFTNYAKVLKNAAVLIPVFIHRPSMYHEAKDHQAIGACLENMLLMAHGLGLGAVWLGEILKNALPVRETLGLGPEYELMAVLALGHPASAEAKTSQRKPLDELVLARLG